MDLQEKLKHLNPFTLSLLNLDEDNLYKLLPKVDNGTMFDGANFKLHPEGLWSNEIFGEMGSPERMKKQAYIDLNLPVIHPVIYKELISSVRFLDEILSGETYAVWNSEEKFFVKSNAIEEKTGFHFLMEHFSEMKIPDTGSPKRQQLIALIEKNKKRAEISKVPVIPAGYRDVEFKDGSIDHDEVNQIYRELITLANSISSISYKSNIQLLDNTRYAIQKTVLKLYMYLGEITGHGKKKLIQAKFASRTVFNGTSNVITATSPSGRFINDKRNLGYNDTMVGLFQQLVAALPFSVKSIKDSFLSEIFIDPMLPVKLINKKTLKLEEVNVSQDSFDLFQSEEGIKKLIQRFRPAGVRHKHVEIDNYYLALIYKGELNGKLVFKIVRDITQLPEGITKESLTPISFIELLYICTIHSIDGKPTIAVRYPVTGIESNIPSTTKVFTTMKSERRYILDDNWEIDETVEPFHHFPIANVETISSMAPPIAALGGMNGDHDGDRNSSTVTLTEESIQEIIEYKKQKRAYVGPDGSIRYPIGYTTVNLVCKNLAVFNEEI